MEREEMMALVASKKTILSAPGTKLSSLYYNVMNSTVDAVEITYNTGRYSNTLSSLDFGSQSQVILANSSFVDTVYIHLELPNIHANQTLSRGWGYAIIRDLSFIFGSSNISQMTINGQTLWHKISMQCENAEKRSELFRLGGEEYLTPVTRLNDAGVAERDPDAVLSADIILPLPWSSASGLFNKKSFDTNLLQNPITIQIQFGVANTIFGGIQTVNPFPTGFRSALMTFRQGDLFNKGMSMRRELEVNPDLSMFYPWIYSQNYLPTQFQGSNNPSNPISIPLLSFINADLLALTIGVVRTSLLAPATGQSPNVFQYDNIQNVVLEYNGTIMFSAPRSSWKLFTTKSALGGQYFHNSLIQPTLNGTGPYQSVPQDAYLLHIDFSALRSMTFEGMMQNTWRIANNTLNLRFTTEGDSTIRYQMFASYHYNSVVGVQQGQTQIYFD